MMLRHFAGLAVLINSLGCMVQTEKLDNLQARVTGACPPGQAVRTIDQLGNVTCEPDDDTQYTAGDGLQLVNQELSVDSSVSRADHMHPQPTVTLDGATTSLQGLADAVESLQQQVKALETFDCPRLVLPGGTNRLYKRNLAVSNAIECGYELEPELVDSMVRVGDFWIDQYEAVIANSQPAACAGALGAATGEGTTARACSIVSHAPFTGLSQLQAALICANVGKRLCTNMEWQVAATGTPDGGASPVDSFDSGCIGPPSMSSCTTCAGAVGLTGQAGQCISRFGAYDMIGNVPEYVADWLPVRSMSTAEVDQEGKWPLEFGEDRTGAFPSKACVTTDCTQSTNGMLGVLFRGGGRSDGKLAGAFFIVGSRGPGVVQAVGFRCCAGRQ